MLYNSSNCSSKVATVFMLFCMSSWVSADDHSAALNISVEAVRKNIVQLEDASMPTGKRSYLLSGAHQYKNVWTKLDFALSVPGALAIGETKAVHDTLDKAFSLQRQDGLLPRLMDNIGTTERTVATTFGISLPFENPIQGMYKTENLVFGIDTNAVLIWAANYYIQETRDLDFARRWYKSAVFALEYLEKNGLVDGFIGGQAPFSDWEDSIRRTGRVALTNEFYILALQGLAQWSGSLDDEENAKTYSERARVLVTNFNQVFWDPELKAIRNFEGDTHLTADANLMAVVHHLVPYDRALEIMSTLRQSPLWNPMPGRPTWPNYPDSMKSILIRFVLMKGYHDEMYWPWIMALAAKAESSIGNCDGYEKIMYNLSSLIESNHAALEVFDLNSDLKTLRPAWRPLYRAETPFTWSAATYIEAETLKCKPNPDWLSYI